MNDLNLLYIEDDAEALEDVVFLLKRSFTKIYTASNGVEGFDLFKENSIDIVLLDINIPKLNGLEVAAKIRKIDENIPILFLTAYSETQKLISAINLQAISYIIKPFNVDELKSSILKAVTKANKEKSTAKKVLLNNGFYWNSYNSELYYKNELLHITKNEILLIKSLFDNRNRFITAEELSEIIFDNKKIENNSMVQLISRFKNKITKKINNKLFFIENIYGQGYRIK
ncbi:response regulator transcription factor [Poseidonibacter ostreae]|jgi:DNA-binding response OmpR family regulator|uniref:Response regulator n=1 Tax=Poseidonibacter ostreae TaxID=2654171 RepID=A0A6L4WVX5_9BACT|nr:response regulator transcription factor [Poseidonibacter ostreae]KAB7887363.1 response regulator [Poseidonibacter ostreae]KAB7890089.1 response regulator [Poseidonibacter ostreae]KAB7890793.1 response regulator [Poseidonibacter ostreae]